MIISREEFHERFKGEFKTIREADELMPVERLYKECQADAAFRNHHFMFDKNTDFSKLEVQEPTEPIAKKFPEIKTEADRLEKIREELIADTYEACPIFKDADYPDVIYVNNGFHRIYQAFVLGYKVIRCRVSYGKFIMSGSIKLKHLVSLLDMLGQLFQKEYHDIKIMRNFLQDAIKKKPELGDTHSIGFSSYKEDSR